VGIMVAPALRRMTASTMNNGHPSRSHAVFYIPVHPSSTVTAAPGTTTAPRGGEGGGTDAGCGAVVAVALLEGFTPLAVAGVYGGAERVGWCCRQVREKIRGAREQEEQALFIN